MTEHPKVVLIHGARSTTSPTAVFLASDESSYVHGDLIKVDGGETFGRYSV
jgi:NAD(P)-dependent dehydrogenase (short-subunit alcohol dehydrogenase family)